MRVYFTHLGCKLNQAEIEKLARQFVAAGHERVGRLEEAELHVVNSCTVTREAARDSRKVARRGRRLDSGLRTVLTGCYASAEPEAAAALEGVDLVVGNADKEHLLEQVHAAFPDAVPFLPAVPETSLPRRLEPGHCRALVKIEDGCNMGCSFCIIPTTRGRQQSRPIAAVVEEVRALAALGYPEIVITGVQISEYDDGGRRLYELVAALLAEPAGPLLRLTSLAPWKFDPRLLELWQDPRLCRHVHLALQSGSTATLRRMRRPYTAATFAALVEKLRAAIPGLAITSDVIVGFPGETAAEFRESLAFVERMHFARPHVFTYSPRAGTSAVHLADPVPPDEARARTQGMLALARESEQRFCQEHLGQVLPVVWEAPRAGRSRGLTDNYIRVVASASDLPLARRVVPARLLATTTDGVVAEPLLPQVS